MINITPKKASSMLDQLNTRNRSINKMHVSVLANEMSRGGWKQNGDAIRISDKMTLIDGQHRLSAVIESGVPINMLVISGLDQSCFDTIDVGKKRSHADTLSVNGEKYAAKIAAALKIVDTYATGRTGMAVRYSNSEVESLLNDKYPDIRDFAGKSDKMKLVSPSIALACHYLFSKKDAEAADWFIDTLRTGCGLSSGDPLLILRERLVLNKLSKSKLNTAYIFILCIKTWNAIRTGQKIKALRFRQEGDCQELVPSIK